MSSRLYDDEFPDRTRDDFAEGRTSLGDGWQDAQTIPKTPYSVMQRHEAKIDEPYQLIVFEQTTGCRASDPHPITIFSMDADEIVAPLIYDLEYSEAQKLAKGLTHRYDSCQEIIDAHTAAIDEQSAADSMRVPDQSIELLEAWSLLDDDGWRFLTESELGVDVAYAHHEQPVWIAISDGKEIPSGEEVHHAFTLRAFSTYVIESVTWANPWSEAVSEVGQFAADNDSFKPSYF